MAELKDAKAGGKVDRFIQDVRKALADRDNFIIKHYKKYPHDRNLYPPMLLHYANIIGAVEKEIANLPRESKEVKLLLKILIDLILQYRRQALITYWSSQPSSLIIMPLDAACNAYFQGLQKQHAVLDHLYEEIIRKDHEESEVRFTGADMERYLKEIRILCGPGEDIDRLDAMLQRMQKLYAITEQTTDTSFLDDPVLEEYFKNNVVVKIKMLQMLHEVEPDESNKTSIDLLENVLAEPSGQKDYSGIDPADLIDVLIMTRNNIEAIRDKNEAQEKFYTDTQKMVASLQMQIKAYEELSKLTHEFMQLCMSIIEKEPEW